MCDFRIYTEKAINRETKEEVYIPHKGTAAINKQIKEWLEDSEWSSYENVPIYNVDKPEAGIYHVVATGSFFAYFNGGQWESAYSNKLYEFQFIEKGCCH